jgi:hypothetical protein
LWLLGGLAGACGGGGGGPRAETAAPLCAEVAVGGEKVLFTHPVVPVDKVLESLIFGGMDPGTLEPINFELGFRLTEVNVPVAAPADLYVRSIERTEFLVGGRAGETDYAIAFDVCATDDGGVVRAAVEGDFAHITALSAALAAHLADESALDCQENAGPEETVRTCRRFFAPGAEGLVIAAGTPIGTGGGTGVTAYAPGFDFNLLDTRFPNAYANDERIGSEEGMGRWFRYGACVYEYFAEPYRAGYLAKVGQNGDLRTSVDAPCGTLSIDKPGSAGGIWIRADLAGLRIDDDWIGVLEGLLVLGPHPVFPGQREVISSEMPAIASWGEGGLLIEFETLGDGDVNRSFYDMLPGTIHCVDGAGFGNPIPHSYFIEVGPGGDTLTIERLEATCAGLPAEKRGFTSAAMQFVR